jgi:hypothetical protein
MPVCLDPAATLCRECSTPRCHDCGEVLTVVGGINDGADGGQRCDLCVYIAEDKAARERRARDEDRRNDYAMEAWKEARHAS